MNDTIASPRAADGWTEGLALQRAGRLDEARRCYEAILARDPRHFEALFLHGMISHQEGRHREAVELFRRAIGVRADVAEAYSNLADALVELGLWDEAATECDKAIALKPGFAEAHVNRGLALHRAGRAEQALASYDAAIRLKPSLGDAYNNRAAVLRDLRRLEAALADCDMAIRLNPRHAKAYKNRGDVHLEQKRAALALGDYDRAAGLKPDYAEALHARGAALHDLKRLPEARASLDQAIALKPDMADWLYLRGLVLRDLGLRDAALADWDRVLGLAGGHAEAHYARGVALQEQGRYGEALAAFDQVIALDAGRADAHLARGFGLLQAGRFDEGWAEHEWRLRDPRARTRTFEQGQPWRGQPLRDGERLFVFHEQGFGDTLQFCRFIPTLRDRAPNLDLSVQPPLAELLQPLLSATPILRGDEVPERFDFHCSLMSLPHLLGSGAAVDPAPAPYLVADRDRRRKLAARLGPRERLRVGIAWSGNPAHRNDANRSIAFAQLAPLLTPEAEWISLQDAIRLDDSRAFQGCGRVRHFGDELKDFSDTAALVDLMDLVVCVDTGVAHLAGALGKPVWILLPFVPDWRWQLDRSDSPWHPSARLFRQPRMGDWPSVVEQVSAAIAAELARP
jgi:tetratricopeptide (TPR) repeat protein